MSHPITYIPPPPEPEPPSWEGDNEFDPGEYTIDEVKAYVQAHLDERDAVLESEVAGKNRVTLVNWLEELEVGEEPPEEDT